MFIYNKKNMMYWICSSSYLCEIIEKEEANITKSASEFCRGHILINRLAVAIFHLLKWIQSVKSKHSIYTKRFFFFFFCPLPYFLKLLILTSLATSSSSSPFPIQRRAAFFSQSATGRLFWDWRIWFQLWFLQVNTLPTQTVFIVFGFGHSIDYFSLTSE